MLILPPGHAERATRPLRIGRRERWFLGSGGVLLAALVVALVISLGSHQRVSGHGCVDVSAATVIGGSELYRCGAGARTLCTGPGRAGREFVSFQRALASACRKAGLPVPFSPSPG
ncbi:MAG TPA: hypothetical protein VG405_09875 [Solirubrobacteraceae bacterium]|jgi:hypothetical protein|nr:hypothetical protein [Solirubrobacteraceae bacterium]